MSQPWADGTKARLMSIYAGLREATISLRHKKQLSQAEMAELLDISCLAYFDIETQDGALFNHLNLNTILSMLIILDVDPLNWFGPQAIVLCDSNRQEAAPIQEAIRKLLESSPAYEMDEDLLVDALSHRFDLVVDLEAYWELANAARIKPIASLQLDFCSWNERRLSPGCQTGDCE